VRLQPENSRMDPLFFDSGDLSIIGKVVGVMRRLG
jgi:SOS-response transcriptional repressor LexA